jgi:hypothetical protein
VKKTYIAGLVIGVTILLVACKPVNVQVSTPSVLALDESALKRTSVARVTAEALKAQLAASPTPSPTETEISVTPAASNTLLPIPSEMPLTPTPNLPCNLVQAGNPIDISIPDGSVFLPGQEFVKTWRIVNAGSCTWTMLYKYSYFSGNAMGAHQENRLLTEVQPGQAVDISVPFVAPGKTGEFESAWMMQDQARNFFGMGLNADAPFYVKIKVEAAPAVTTPNP